MDGISYAHSAKQAQRIEKFIENPDSNSGILTQPSVIQAGETVTVPAGRTAILANTQIDGTLTVNGTVFIPSGATTTDIDTKLSTKVAKVTSTDNAIVRFDGTTGDVQNSGVIIDDNGNVGIGVTPSAWVGLTKAIQLNQYGAAVGASTYSSVNAFLVSNSYQSNINTWNYTLSGSLATKYEQLGGTHQWYTAPAGTADNPISWTNVMTLNANGNLLVGTTTDNGVDKLQVNGSISSGSIYQYTSGDLNDLKVLTQTVGTYPNMLNVPIYDHGYLEVIVYTLSWVLQRFTCLGVTNPAYAGRTFVRCWTSGTTWTAWVEK